MKAGVFPVSAGADRVTVAGILAAPAGLAWAYLIRGADLGIGASAGGGAMQMAPMWTPGQTVRIFVMWAVMMAAMMLPAAVRTTVRIVHRRRERPELNGALTAMLFASGSLCVWTGFGAAAALAQWSLDRAGALSGSMAVRGPAVAALILLAVGLYQFTPLKEACLRRCRESGAYVTPVGRDGAGAALEDGVRYGVAGLGSCGPLTGLLFVGGVMNLLWIGGLAALMFVEQALPWPKPANWVTGAAFLLGGGVALAAVTV